MYFECTIAADPLRDGTLTPLQINELEDALNTVQALLHASGHPTNTAATNTLMHLMCALDYTPDEDISERERLAALEDKTDEQLERWLLDRWLDDQYGRTPR